LRLAALASLVTVALASPAAAQRVEIRVSPALQATPVTGRMYVFVSRGDRPARLLATRDFGRTWRVVHHWP